MSQSAHMNGPASPTGKFIDTIDPEDPEYRRNLQRPAEVKEDMKQMEGRSRVSVVLNSQAFREELEAVIQEQIRQGGPASLFALQQISDLLLPQARGAYSSFGRSSPVIPVNDIRGVETFGYSKQEKVLRCKLAACYRLVDLFGWTHGIFNHISARVSQDQEQFLVNPFGMLYSEITASTLIKVDVRGEVVDTGSTGLGISKAGFTLHSAIHQARPDIRCVIHLHTPAAVAVSATKRGLLPMSQEALICGKVSYHDYCGILVDQEERDQLARNLGPFNKVMFLRNHGVVACGETVEEAFHYAFNVMAAVDVQVKAMPVGLENLVLVDEETQERTFRIGSQGGGGTDTSGRRWRCGELEWDAFMRTLDNSGYRTGHAYKQPLMKQEKKERTNSDVEVPPSSSSFTYVFDGDYEHSKYVSPIKTAMERQKQAYKAGWLTSPNTYKKQEIEEIGTTTPKKITKWITDGEASNQQSTAIKVENPNLFAPQGDNPKEFKEKQKSIRKDYYEEKITAGPQSKILEGISWDEATKMKEGGDQTVVVGAASKGIIQRDHQHNAVVYRSYYAANPFEAMSEEEVSAYKQEVERRDRGEEPEDVPAPDGRLISTEERMQNIQQSREDVQQDTEENTTQETNIDSIVNGENESKYSPPPPASPKEPKEFSRLADPLPLAPQLQEEGLDQLVDTVIQAAMASAVSTSISKGQHSPGGDGRGVGSPSARFYAVPPHSSSVSEPHPEIYSPRETLFCTADSSQFEIISDVHENDPSIKTVKLGAKTSAVEVQLRPFKGSHGKPEEGVMKISFTIRSKVTRRKTRGAKHSWPIENVIVTQSQPQVTIVHPEGGQQSEEKMTDVIPDQQNVVSGQPSEKDELLMKTPTYQQKPAKRIHQPSRKSQKVAKSKKKSRCWHLKDKILIHPLSPVREEFLEEESTLDEFLEEESTLDEFLKEESTLDEFLEEESTLDALLAQQNLEVDFDESLEDLMHGPDFKEMLAADNKQHQTCTDISAPVAVAEDLEQENPVYQLEQTMPPGVFLGTNQEAVLNVSRVKLNELSQKDADYSTIRESSCPAECDTSVQEAPGSEKTIGTEEHFVYADEVSNNLQEVTNGDTAPRRQEETTNDTDIVQREAECDLNQEKENMCDSALPGENKSHLEPEIQTNERICGTIIKTRSPLNVPSLPVCTMKISEASLNQESLVHPKEKLSTSVPSIHQEENKTDLFRSEAISLESSPTVNMPLLDALPPEPISKGLYRVHSLGNELDEHCNKQKSLSPKHSVLRRVQSAGPVWTSQSSLSSECSNVAVIDAVLHTVTIDPAKLAKSGQTVSAYLSQKQGKESLTAEKKQNWTLMDTVSKSLENLDVDSLTKEGSLIYGRSLEVSVRSGVLPKEPVSEKSLSLKENLVGLPETENSIPTETRLYKDDLVIITKAPMDFSAISPHKRKDIAEEDEPLVTSSPKLGRRKEGSFKKYQCRMGKSEETLLEVIPVPTRRKHQSARRAKSFPGNFDVVNSQSQKPLLKNNSSLIQTAEGVESSSSQSMSVLVDDFQQSSDSVAGNKNQEKKRPDEIFNTNVSSSARSSDDMETYDNRNEEKNVLDTRGQGKHGDQPRRHKKRALPEELDVIDDIVAIAEDDAAEVTNSKRDRRRRRQKRYEELSRQGPEGRTEHKEESRETVSGKEDIEHDDYNESDFKSVAVSSSSTVTDDYSDLEKFPPPPEELLRSDSELTTGEVLFDSESLEKSVSQSDTIRRHASEHLDDGVPQQREKQSKFLSTEISYTQFAEEMPRLLLNRGSVKDNFTKEITEITSMSASKETLKANQREGNFRRSSALPSPEDEKNLIKYKDIGSFISVDLEGTVPIAGNLDIVNYGDERHQLRSRRSRRIRRSSLVEDRTRQVSHLAEMGGRDQIHGKSWSNVSSLPEKGDTREIEALESRERTRRSQDNLMHGIDILTYDEEPPRVRKSKHKSPVSVKDDGDKRNKHKSPVNVKDDGDKRNKHKSPVSVKDEGDERRRYKSPVSVKDDGDKRNKHKSPVNVKDEDDERSRYKSPVSVKDEGDERRRYKSPVSVKDDGDKRNKHKSPDNVKDEGDKRKNTEMPRSERRIKGRREAHRDGSSKMYMQEKQERYSQAQIEASSRERLNQEKTALQFPSKQHYRDDQIDSDHKPTKSKSQDFLHDQSSDLENLPPELLHKKTRRKKLSCISGEEMTKPKYEQKDQNSQDDSLKSMPFPAPEEDYKEKSRRQQSKHVDHLQFSFEGSYNNRQHSFDTYSGKEEQHRFDGIKDTEGTSSYYDDNADELHGAEHISDFKVQQKVPNSDVRNSLPHTAHSAGKTSTNAYGSEVGRRARSVSFGDDFMPPSDPLERHKSGESLGSESYWHSTSYRMRSFSGASEGSMGSNPLNYEPWRARAAAHRQHSRPQRSRSHGELTYSAHSGRRRRSRTPGAADANRLYQPRKNRFYSSLPDAPMRPAVPSEHNNSRDTSMLADGSFSDAYSHGYASESIPPQPIRRTESARQPEKNPELIRELERKGIGRSKSDRRSRGEGDGDKPGSPTKSDPMDSASGGETLEEHSSKEGSPTKEAPSPTKEKKKKKKFRMPSFSKKKKDSKESAI